MSNFQAKCFNKLREIKASGTTIVIVSHSLGQIEQICDRSIWICEGKIAMEGKPKEVHLEYLDYMNTPENRPAGKRTVTPSEAGITEYAGRRRKKAQGKMKALRFGRCQVYTD